MGEAPSGYAAIGGAGPVAEPAPIGVVQGPYLKKGRSTVANRRAKTDSAVTQTQMISPTPVSGATHNRPRIIEHIAEARSHGDLSENAEYHAAKEEQSHNEGRIAELEDKLARADIIDISKLSGDTIKFGATVTLVDEDTEKKAVWQIVGEVEADAKKGKISITSPMARALIGKAKGANVEVVTPGGAKAYDVKKVEFR